MKNERIRNIAIIAHVDHGKTTLVDAMLRQGGAFRDNQIVEERVMDSNDLEKERGITIMSKNTAIRYGDYKINIVDTPGHADFGGEVERILKMVNGALLVVDSLEGTMPQTRFVLEHALLLGLPIIIVVNKMDRAEARPKEVVDEVLELLMDLNASDEQLDSPVVFCSAKNGIASLDCISPGRDLTPLFEEIINHIPAPSGDENAPMQVLISALDYSDYVGSMGIGRVERGSITLNQPVAIVNYHAPGELVRAKVSNMYVFEGLGKQPVEKAEIGDIICISGIEGVSIGDTICSIDRPEPIEFPKISEPSVEMTFMVNDSPLSGKDGKFVTSRHLRARLYKEAVKDVSLKVRDGDTSESFVVSSRGEMHLTILIETMRREGYEFQVSMPKVILKEINGQLCEPIDAFVADVPEDCVGTVMEKMGRRKGELKSLSPLGSRMRLEFSVPSRGLFGFKSEFLTDTKGEGIMTSVFDSYEPFRGEISRRQTGSLIAHESGDSITYGLFNAQERGSLFIGAGVPVYMGMVVGESSRAEDIVVNVCKKKQLTNTRSSASDEALRLTPCKQLSLEQAIEFLADDELLEVTPKTFRIRKSILDTELRMKEWAKNRKR